MSLSVDVMHGPQPAVDLEQDCGVSPALHPGEPIPCPWPLHNYFELVAVPTALASARLHARNLLWEWGLDWLAPDAELLVAELIANAVKVTSVRDEAAVRLRLSSDGTQVLIEVWDAHPWPPTVADRGQDGRLDPQPERGRGLGLVAALSTRWDWYLTTEPRGKVVWCEIGVLARAARMTADHGVGCKAGSRSVNLMMLSSSGAEFGTRTGGPSNHGLPSGFCARPTARMRTPP